MIEFLIRDCLELKKEKLKSKRDKEGVKNNHKRKDAYV